jgi:hypothetical protein
VARAKRFDRTRAEARRRYRASQAAAERPLSDDEETVEAAAVAEAPAGTGPASSSPTRRTLGRLATTRTAPQPPQGSLGLGAAFRAAFRQANLAEDLRELPRLLVHRAVWAPIALSAASLLLVLILGPKHPVSSFAFSTFVLPPALAAVFINGFFVPRASYLTGAVVATVAAMFYALFWLLGGQGIVPDLEPVTADRIAGEAATAFAIGPISGVVFGAAAAWYRRFLYLSSPARRQNRGGQGGGRRATANRPGSRRR